MIRIYRNVAAESRGGKAHRELFLSIGTRGIFIQPFPLRIHWLRLYVEENGKK